MDALSDSSDCSVFSTKLNRTVGKDQEGGPALSLSLRGKRVRNRGSSSKLSGSAMPFSDDHSTEKISELDSMIALAKAKKAALLSNPKPSTSKRKCHQDDSHGIDSQAYIAFGKMEYNFSSNCGVKVKGSSAMKIYVNKYASYTVVLGKVADQLFEGDTDEESEYYLADSTGLPVCPDESSITVQDEQGSDVVLDWNMANYMKAAGVRWQSKVRLFCVKKNVSSKTESDNDRDASKRAKSTSVSHMEIEHSPGSDLLNIMDQTITDASRRAKSTIDQTEISILPATTPAIPASGLKRQDHVPDHSEQGSQARCEPYFVKTTRSRYGKQLFSARFGTQSSILEVSCAGDITNAAGGMEALESLVDSFPGDNNKLYPVNPCQLDGVYFTGLEIHGAHEMSSISLLRNFNDVSGELEYYSPMEGVAFSKWTGARAQNHVALLTCMAMNGYHGSVEYTWFREGSLLECERYPVLYISASGQYMCHIYSSEHLIDSWSTFKVETGIQTAHCVCDLPNNPLQSAYVNEVELETDGNKSNNDSEATHQEDSEGIGCTDATQSTATPPGGTSENKQGDHVELVSKVGEGTFGVVYKALFQGKL